LKSLASGDLETACISFIRHKGTLISEYSVYFDVSVLALSEDNFFTVTKKMGDYSMFSLSSSLQSQTESQFCRKGRSSLIFPSSHNPAPRSPYFFVSFITAWYQFHSLQAYSKCHILVSQRNCRAVIMNLATLVEHPLLIGFSCCLKGLFSWTDSYRVAGMARPFF